jgi:hypothetical protein
MNEKEYKDEVIDAAFLVMTNKKVQPSNIWVGVDIPKKAPDKFKLDVLNSVKDMEAILETQRRVDRWY